MESELVGDVFLEHAIKIVSFGAVLYVIPSCSEAALLRRALSGDPSNYGFPLSRE